MTFERNCCHWQLVLASGPRNCDVIEQQPARLASLNKPLFSDAKLDQGVMHHHHHILCMVRRNAGPQPSTHSYPSPFSALNLSISPLHRVIYLPQLSNPASRLPFCDPYGIWAVCHLCALHAEAAGYPQIKLCETPSWY